MGFDKSVFVNCPFDDEYVPLLRPLLFTIIYLGFRPRIALEELDSGSPRIQKIISLIRNSKYAIHDLSRLRAAEVGEYYRLNMPFELGVDVGCRIFGKGRLAKKRCLLLEKERYRYQVAISDLSNSDIASHNGEPQDVVSAVRNWLNHEAGLHAPGPSKGLRAFLEFMADNYAVLKRRGFSDRDIERLPVSKLISCIHQWVADNKPQLGIERG